LRCTEFYRIVRVGSGYEMSYDMVSQKETRVWAVLYDIDAPPLRHGVRGIILQSADGGIFGHGYQEYFGPKGWVGYDKKAN
jgi:hypothetical protein